MWDQVFVSLGIKFINLIWVHIIDPNLDGDGTQIQVVMF